MSRRDQTWLMKSEPEVYSIDDLQRDRQTPWTGVRNFQARNFMRDGMRVGDQVLFYHSNADPAGVAGVGRVAGAAYADPTQFDRASEYFEPRATPENPVWMLVEIAFVRKFPRLVTLDALRAEPGLTGLMLLRRGSRLSIQPVNAEHAKLILTLGSAS
jgi:predicted RNA-binding protein with PUA-like domain